MCSFWKKSICTRVLPFSDVQVTLVRNFCIEGGFPCWGLSPPANVFVSQSLQRKRRFHNWFAVSHRKSVWRNVLIFLVCLCWLLIQKLWWNPPLNSFQWGPKCLCIWRGPQIPIASARRFIRNTEFVEDRTRIKGWHLFCCILQTNHKKQNHLSWNDDGRREKCDWECHHCNLWWGRQIVKLELNQSALHHSWSLGWDLSCASRRQHYSALHGEMEKGTLEAWLCRSRQEQLGHHQCPAGTLQQERIHPEAHSGKDHSNAIF